MSEREERLAEIMEAERVRLAEIKADLHQGDVAVGDIAWLIQELEAAWERERAKNRDGFRTLVRNLRQSESAP